MILFSSKAIRLSKKESEIIDLVKINKISSIKDYSSFIIYSLYKYIKTSHILIVQWDGYIINPEKWDPNFLKYDYVGAPFIPHAEIIKTSNPKQNLSFKTIFPSIFAIDFQLV